MPFSGTVQACAFLLKFSEEKPLKNFALYERVFGLTE
jgi:hypothetical protein